MGKVKIKTAEQISAEKAQKERERLNAITVSRFQIMAALDEAGLLDKIEEYMARKDTPRIEKLAWQEISFRRGSKMIAKIAERLEITEEQLDELFLAAQEIEE